MRIILRENIESLGKKGEIVNVAAGYGRNYLIPKKLALEVTSTNMKMIEIEKKVLQKGLEKDIASYNALIERLNQVSIKFSRKTGEKDVLFGSVSSSDIKDSLEELGFEIEKKRIMLDEPIKRLGNYTVAIKVFHDEKAEIKLEVIAQSKPEKKVKSVEDKKEKETEQPEEEEKEISAEKPEPVEEEEKEKETAKHQNEEEAKEKDVEIPEEQEKPLEPDEKPDEQVEKEEPGDDEIKA